MKWFANLSLFAKLIFIFLLSIIILVLLLRSTTDSGFKKYYRDSVRPHLYQYFSYIHDQIGTPPNLKKAQELSDQLKIKILIHGPSIRWSSDGTFPKRRAIHFRRHHRKDHNRTMPEKKHIKNYPGYESGVYRGNLVIGIRHKPYKTLFITNGESNLPSPWGLILHFFFAVTLVLLLLYFAIRWIFSPLTTMRNSVKRIGSGDLVHRIPIKRKDELGELSTDINAMADDIHNMLEAKRQLLLAISHELRSPITRAKVALSLMEDGPLKQGLQDDINEMESMVSELLEAEKLNHRHQVLQITSVNINLLIQDSINKYYPKESIIVDLDSSLSIQKLDEARIQFVIKNLIGNALQHRKNSSDSITVRNKLLTKEQAVAIYVIDNGVGIDEQHIPQLTEPFYRVDPSRQRQTGGYGLGLYIIKRIVEAHHGQLDIQSKVDQGTTVTVTLPYDIKQYTTPHPSMK